MKTNITLPTLSIGIPAHNEARNIATLLNSIQRQKATTFVLEKIYVVCDGCTDTTKKNAQMVSKSDDRIVVIEDKKRLGKATRLNQIYQKNTSDLLLTLDADVLLDRVDEIERLLNVMDKRPGTLVVGGNMIPVKPTGFIATVLYTNALLWDEVRIHLNGGDHIANLFGSASLLKSDFAKECVYPTTITCDEEYLYVKAAKQNGFAFAFDTRILYRAASALSEIQIQGTRFHRERQMLVTHFGKDVLKYHDVPLKIKLRSILTMLVRSPFFTILAVGVNFWIRTNPKVDSLNEYGMWKQISSTKKAIRRPNSVRYT